MLFLEPIFNMDKKSILLEHCKIKKFLYKAPLDVVSAGRRVA